MTTPTPAGDTQPGGDNNGAVWVSSWAMPKGRGYGVRMRLGSTTWGLTPDDAVAHATAAIRAAVTAEHDAAVATLLAGKLSVPLRDVAMLFERDLRPDRPDLDAHTDPLLLRPGVAVDEGVDRSRTFRPFVALHLADEDGQAGEFTPADCRHHATSVLDTIAGADLDSGFRRLLVGTLGLGEARASAVIADLGNHWPADQEPRRA